MPPPVFTTVSIEEAKTPLIHPESVPLCVDLDGTLIKSDTFQDSLLLLVRTHPARLLAVARLLPRGRARLKQEIARQTTLDINHLPWNKAVLRLIRDQRSLGRTILLVTGADRSLAERVASHLRCFDRVIASDGERNLTGCRKLAVLQKLFPAFDYIGNARIDLPLLTHARHAFLANPTHRLRRALARANVPVKATLLDRAPLRASLLSTLRLHQWVKNLLLLLPLLLSHRLTPRGLIHGALALVAFGCAASACYVLNDLLDIDNARRHRHKRLRSFASGELGVVDGILLVMALLIGSALLLPLLPAAFAIWLAIYIAATTLYSLWLKRIAIADVLLLAGLYTLRLYAGGAATQTPISPWLAVFALFFFLALALVKRLNELEILRQQGSTRTPGRGYRVADIVAIGSLEAASACAALAVFAAYITHPNAELLYPHAARLWLALPPLGLWLLRMGLLAWRGELDEDPVLFALRDRLSPLLGLLVVLLTVFAAF